MQNLIAQEFEIGVVPWGIPMEHEMRAHLKKYWVIEITKRNQTIFRKRLNGNLSSSEITTILQRLASRELSPIEIISASIRKPQKSPFLEARISGPPHGKRVMIWLPLCPDYTAAHWHVDELEDYPEIISED